MFEASADDAGKNVCYASGIANFRKNAQFILPLRRLVIEREDSSWL
jgi:hypothetical protein